MMSHLLLNSEDNTLIYLCGFGRHYIVEVVILRSHWWMTFRNSRVYMVDTPVGQENMAQRGESLLNRIKAANEPVISLIK